MRTSRKMRAFELRTAPRAGACPFAMTRRPRVRALLALLAALPATFAHAAVDLTDDAGHRLHLERPAQRIVSLAPHVTELLFAAGAGSKGVGVVQHSDYPPEAARLPQVGSHTRVDLEAVAALKPDLVIAWKSGNRDTQLDRFSALGIPVYVNEPRSLEAVAQSLEQFGRLADTEAVANAAAAGFRQRHQHALGAGKRRVIGQVALQSILVDLQPFDEAAGRAEQFVADQESLRQERPAVGAVIQRALQQGVRGVMPGRLRHARQHTRQRVYFFGIDRVAFEGHGGGADLFFTKRFIPFPDHRRLHQAQVEREFVNGDAQRRQRG